MWKRWEDQEGGGKNKAEEGSKEGNVYAQGRKKKKKCAQEARIWWGDGHRGVKVFFD